MLITKAMSMLKKISNKAVPRMEPENLRGIHVTKCKYTHKYSME